MEHEINIRLCVLLGMKNNLKVHSNIVECDFVLRTIQLEPYCSLHKSQWGWTKHNFEQNKSKIGQINKNWEGIYFLTSHRYLKIYLILVYIHFFFFFGVFWSVFWPPAFSLFLLPLPLGARFFFSALSFSSSSWFSLSISVINVLHLLCSSIAVLDLINQSKRNCGAHLRIQCHGSQTC